MRRSSVSPFAQALSGSLAIVLAVGACGGSGSSPSLGPTAGPSLQPSSAPGTASLAGTSNPGESALPTQPPSQAPGQVATPPASLYVRRWFVNASVGPLNFDFNQIVVSGGRLYYVPEAPVADDPPLYVTPVARTISQAGLATIAATIQSDGLLGSTTSWECPHDPNAGRMTGTGTDYLEIVVGGVKHELSAGCPYGQSTPTPAAATPGTYWAFVDFLAKLGNAEGWLGEGLGPKTSWDPDRMAVMVWPAEEPASSAGPTNPATQPTLWRGTVFASFGTPAVSGERCGILTGSALTAQLPSLRTAHQSTWFIDNDGDLRQIDLHLLLPDEPPPEGCS